MGALNAATMVVIMIETAEVLEQLDNIAAVGGVDLLLIGTNDLCASLGSLLDAGTSGAGPFTGTRNARKWTAPRSGEPPGVRTFSCVPGPCEGACGALRGSAPKNCPPQFQRRRNPRASPRIRWCVSVATPDRARRRARRHAPHRTFLTNCAAHMQGSFTRQTVSSRQNEIVSVESVE